MKNRLKVARIELLLLFLKMPVDLLMITSAFIFAYFLRLKLGPASTEFMALNEYIYYIFILLPIWIIIFALNGLYINKNQGLLSEYNKVGTAVSVMFMLIFGILFLTRTLFFSRLLILYAWIITIILVSLGRTLIWFIRKFLYRQNIGVSKIVIVGAGKVAQSIALQIKNNGKERQLLAFVDVLKSNKKQIMGLPVVNGFHNLTQNINLDDISEIIWTGKGLDSQAASELVNFCQDEKIRFRYIPNLFEAQATNIDIETVAGIPIISLKKTPLEGWGRILKTFVDIFAAMFGLILASPIFLLISLAINLDSEGPVFFIQKRIGKDHEFLFFKFRTMIKNAPKLLNKVRAEKNDTGPFINVKCENDPRMTRVGKFLRKTSLDELPQLLNILRGEMSLVGPRPLAPKESKAVENFAKQYRIRRYVKPGLTGLWQVLGRSEMSAEERIRLDIYYAENWSLLLDLQILLKSFWAIISRKGAY